jgi:uncharacterized protein (TIGR02145 family)
LNGICNQHTFQEPVSLNIEVPDNILLENATFIGPLDINTGYLAWYDSKIDITQRTISSEINHFSRWVIGKISDEKFFEKTYTYNLKNLPSSANFSLQFLLRNDIYRSFKKWEAYSKATNIYFQETTDQDPDIGLGFVKVADIEKTFGSLLLGNQWFGVCLWDLYSDKRFILFNDDLNWNSTIALANNFNNDAINIERILTHEIGHYFGLKDIKSPNPLTSNSVMGSGDLANTPLSICECDLSNIKMEYPKISSFNEYQCPIEIEKISPLNSIIYGYSEQIINDVKVKIVDASDAGVPNVTVVFRLALDTNVGTISEPVVATDATGIALLKSLVLPNNIGDYVLTARTWLGGPINARPRDCIFNVTTVEPTSNIIDIEGNVYKTVKIGTQTWMGENLKTTKYNNGDLIGTTTPSTKDYSLEPTPKYQWASNGNESTVSTYGRLYTWDAVNDNRGLYPTGWHVPTDNDWTILTNYLGGESKAGGKLKETGITYWPSPNLGATNESSFSALPGGYHDRFGSFYNFGYSAFWWSATEGDAIHSWCRYLYHIDNIVYNGNLMKSDGYSVRCVTDN